MYGQSELIFDDTQLATIQIFIDPDSLALIYAPGNEENDHEYPARFIFRNAAVHDSVENIGFRLRGNTSRYAAKKSFKVSFNTFERGRKFYRLEKLNLNGEHNDPSVIRAKLCWDLFKTMQVPSSRAFHTRFILTAIIMVCILQSNMSMKTSSGKISQMTAGISINACGRRT